MVLSDRLACTACKRGERSANRRVEAHSAEANKHFVSNAVTNTSYSWYTFVPKNLWIQFGSFENVYFLFIAVLQLFPEITPVSPITTWGPLIVVMSITALKDLMDDLARWRADARYNNRPVNVIRSGGMMVSVKAHAIRVGDFVVLGIDEEIPCDVMLLTSSDSMGKAFIQTTNLDGETNLKTRTALEETRGLGHGATTRRRSNFAIMQHLAVACKAVAKSDVEWIECSAPDDRIYEWDARIKLRSVAKPVAASAAQMLLQTTKLRTTEWAIGIAIYTGNETKFGMNKKAPPPKKTRTDTMISRFSIAIFAFQVRAQVHICASAYATLLCGAVHRSRALFPPSLQLVLVTLLGLTGAVLQVTVLSTNAWYLAISADEPWYKTWVVIPARFLLLNSTMIPISLKVTMDLAKLVMSLFIDLDTEMWDPEDVPTSCGCGRFSFCIRSRRAQSTSIAEDLGQVQYVLSDKTGTLTNNEMVLRRIVCDDVVSSRMVIYGSPLESRVAKERVRPEAGSQVAEDALEGIDAFVPAPGAEADTSSLVAASGAGGAVAGPSPGSTAVAHETVNPLMALKRRFTDVADVVGRGLSVGRGSTRRSGGVPADAPRINGRDASAGSEHHDGVRVGAESVVPEDMMLSEVASGIGYARGTRVAVECAARRVAVDPNAHSRTESQWRGATVLGAHEYDGRLEYDVLHDEGTMLPSSVTAQFDEYTSGASRAAVRRAAKLQGMLRAMALNHEVSVNQIKEGAAASEEKMGAMWIDPSVVYRASSPDEIALVEGAAACGSVLVENDDNIVRIRLPRRRRGDSDDGGDLFETYRVLSILEFSSDRKRMSVVLRGPLPNDGADPEPVLRCDGSGLFVNGPPLAPVTLIMKGADNKVFERVAMSEKHKVPSYEKELEQLAMKGLRTLVYAHKSLTEEMWQQWKSDLAEASIALEGRKEAVEMCYDNIEHGMLICGATAIEDRLQDGVGDTMRALQGAGIKCWMLTGDKVTTAIEIAIMSLMHERSTPLFRITCDEIDDGGMTDKEVSAYVGGLIDECWKRLKHAALEEMAAGGYASSDAFTKERKFTMCLDGVAVQHALADHEMKFQALCLAMPTVLCCRVTPKQKAAIVRLMKSSGRVTLSIGDGGNDVPMIQEAHVGVGIRGKEGKQAANAADFVLARFRFLKRLVLLHGFWSYSRSALIAQYSFYKSLTFCFIQVSRAKCRARATAHLPSCASVHFPRLFLFVHNVISLVHARARTHAYTHTHTLPSLQIIFGFFSGFSGASLFNSLCVGSCNAVVFWSVICFVLDRAYPEDVLLRSPGTPGFINLYAEGQKMQRMNGFGFLSKWCLRAVFHGVVLSMLYMLTDTLRGADSSTGGPESGSGYHSAGLITFFAWCVGVACCRFDVFLRSRQFFSHSQAVGPRLHHA